ncbi:MAG TPA: NYN domain-containing protein, partial [Candidatus Dietzia intestinigallinarum]|nr:NYN domain-containing protein [Candidatus Dietzia intestinigallinarum]
SGESASTESVSAGPPNGASRPNPSMMAPHRRPLRSKFVPLPEEVWTSSGEQTPFDVGQQYATWWYEQAATEEQRDDAHLLSGGALPPSIDRPLLQFACQMLNEFTLSETQRVRLRDGFHEGIRAVLLKHR